MLPGDAPDGRGDLTILSVASNPVTTLPIFLHLQPVVAPLAISEPPILLPSKTTEPGSSPTPPKHLYFLMTLQDPTHSLRFTTVSQPSPADWLDVEYDKSDWVEERLVEILRTGVEVVAQDVCLSTVLAPLTAFLPSKRTECRSIVRGYSDGHEAVNHSACIPDWRQRDSDRSKVERDR